MYDFWVYERKKDQIHKKYFVQLLGLQETERPNSQKILVHERVKMNRTRPTSKPAKQRVSPILIPCQREWTDVMGNNGKATDASGTMVAEAPVVREVKLGDAQLTGVDNDFDAEPTGVELGEPECL